MKKSMFSLLLLYASFTVLAQKKSDSSITATPVIKIAKEPRFLVNVHSGYSTGLGSTFKFYPADVASIVMTQQGTNQANKQVSYTNPAKGLGDGFKVGFGASYIIKVSIPANL